MVEIRDGYHKHFHVRVFKKISGKHKGVSRRKTTLFVKSGIIIKNTFVLERHVFFQNAAF